MNFDHPVLITGIQTQGSGSRSYQRWVTMLQIQTGNSESSLAYILDDGKHKVRYDLAFVHNILGSCIVYRKSLFQDFGLSKKMTL